MLSASLQGCETVDNAVAQAKSSAAAFLPPSASASGAATRGPGIAGSELANIFKRYPLGSPQSRDNYPRAAITIVSASAAVLQPGASSADQCVQFNVRLWANAKSSRAFDGLQLCAQDKSSGVPFRTLTYWPRQYLPGDTTGAVRTDGPRRPTTNFPTEPKVATAWFSERAQGIFFIGSILYQLGYDWDQPGENRLWFVSAPSP